jgi:hypothetical protein
LPWGVLCVIEKFLKCRCPKWPRIGHLDIFRPSYGQKKGRESNWQFDSRPLKVENRPALPTSKLRVPHGVGKILTRATSLIQTSLRSNFAVGSYEFPKSQDSNWDSFGTISGLQLGSPGKKCHSGASAAEWHREYYREDGGDTSRVQVVVCHVSPS